MTAGAQSGSHLLTSTSTFSIYDEPGSIEGAQDLLQAMQQAFLAVRDSLGAILVKEH